MEDVLMFVQAHSQELATVGGTVLGLNIIPDRFQTWIRDDRNVLFVAGKLLTRFFGPGKVGETQ